MNGKIIVMLGLAAALAGCSGADGAQDGLVDGELDEVSEAFERINLTSPFANNQTYEIQHIADDGTKRTIGYVFASLGHTSGVSQEQRWVLYDALPLPVGNLSFKAPTVDRQYTSLPDFVSALTMGAAPLWPTSGNRVYVKVESTSYDHVPSEVTEGGPGVVSNPQLIDEMAAIYRMNGDGSPVLQGYAYGGPTGDDGIKRNTEYWVMNEGYVSELDSPTRRLRLNVSAKKGAKDYVLSNFVEGKSTLTVAQCSYFINALPQAL